MEYQSCVLLYSNYSPLSQQLLTALKSCPIDLAQIRMDSLCIDNEKIRKKILAAQNINISIVPTILVLFTNGGMKKYEGKLVFEWLEQIVASHLPPPPPPPPPPPDPEVTPPDQRPTSPPEEEEARVPKVVRQFKNKKSRPTQVQSSPSKKVEQSSKIEDLDSSEEEEEENMDEDVDSEDANNLVPPPMSIRNGPGGYDFSKNPGKKMETNRDMSKKFVRSLRLV